MVQDNRTAALEILTSADYNNTLAFVNATMYALGDLVQHNSDAQTQTVCIRAIVGMCVVVEALLYTIPATIYLLTYERRHTKQVGNCLDCLFPVFAAFCVCTLCCEVSSKAMYFLFLLDLCLSPCVCGVSCAFCVYLVFVKCQAKPCFSSFCWIVLVALCLWSVMRIFCYCILFPCHKLHCFAPRLWINPSFQ
jgi:hypothetical protein